MNDYRWLVREYTFKDRARDRLMKSFERLGIRV